MRRKHLPVPVHDLRVAVVVSTDRGEGVRVHETTERVPTLNNNSENGIQYDMDKYEPSRHREDRVLLRSHRQPS